MRIKIFTIPVFGEESAAIGLDEFLANHRIISLDRQFINNGSNSAWSVFVTYIDTAVHVAGVKRGKIDYKEKLNDNDFIIYSQLRDLRKQVAEQEGVPVYALFTNEQLASMVERRVSASNQLREISGIGAAKVEKYGQVFIQLLKQSFSSLANNHSYKSDQNEAQ